MSPEELSVVDRVSEINCIMRHVDMHRTPVNDVENTDVYKNKIIILIIIMF